MAGATKHGQAFIGVTPLERALARGAPGCGPAPSDPTCDRIVNTQDIDGFVAALFGG
jgi:hypothetical protein